MQDTYIDRGLCIFLMQMLKTVSISFSILSLLPPLYKNHKKPEVEHARHLHWPRALYFPHADAQNSQYFIY